MKRPFIMILMAVLVLVVIGLGYMFWPAQSPSNGVTSIAEIWENPEAFNLKSATVQGRAEMKDLEESYAVVLTESSDLFFSKAITLKPLESEQVYYLKNISCVDSDPILRASGIVSITYQEVSEFRKTVDSVKMSPGKIEFINCR